MKKGIESWQPAFEAAGFKNGDHREGSAVARAGSRLEPGGRPLLRHPLAAVDDRERLRARTSTTRAAGEILESDIQFHHNVMNLARELVLRPGRPARSAREDAAAARRPDGPPDRVRRRARGRPHARVPAQHEGQLDVPRGQSCAIREWLKKMGHTPTLMDYSRFNYVAQPEDNIDVADLVPGIGPYDKWATMWGYKPIPGARTSATTRRRRSTSGRASRTTTPYLRFSTAGSRGADPGELTEAVGDEDAVASTTLGLKNLEARGRHAAAGDDHQDRRAVRRPRRSLRAACSASGRTEMNHVAAIVGGFSSQQKHAGQQGVLFKPIAREKAGDGRPASSTTTRSRRRRGRSIPDILRRIEPVGVLDRIRTGQQRVLNSLLSSARISRLVEQEALDGPAAYRPLDFLADVRKGVWSEVYNGTRGQGRRLPAQPAARLRRDAGRPHQRPAGRASTTRGPSSAASSRRSTPTCARPLARDDRPGDAAAHRRRPHADSARARSHGPGDRPPAAARRALDATRSSTSSIDPESCWVDYAIRGQKVRSTERATLDAQSGFDSHPWHVVHAAR